MKKKILIILLIISFVAIVVFLIVNKNSKIYTNYNDFLGISKTEGIITLGMGTPTIAANEIEAARKAKEYFKYVNEHEKLDFVYSGMQENNEAYLVKYILKDTSRAKIYFQQRLKAAEPPKKDAKVILYIFKQKYYDGKKLYVNTKKEVKKFGDLAILFRRIDSNNYDEVCGSNVTDEGDRYVYTAKIKDIVQITTGEWSAVVGEKEVEKEIKFYLNKNTYEIEHDIYYNPY